MSDKNLDFILKYQDDVLRFCFYLCRNEAQARDLAQECFLKALQLKHRPDRAKAFLFQVAKNTHIDFLRKQKSEKTYLSNLSVPTTIDETDLSVWQALFSLDPEDQEVLLLVDREGLSLIEAAELVGVSEAALKSRLFRARDNFKKKWKS